jgi:hypothetical protein
MKIPPFIATLGMMMLLKGLSLVVSADKPIYFNDTENFYMISQDSLIGYVLPSVPIPNADQWLAHHVGRPGMADRRDRPHHHSRGLRRHLATQEKLTPSGTKARRGARLLPTPNSKLNGLARRKDPC